MRKFLPLMLCLLSLNIYGQQRVNTFHVVDVASGKAISAASISIIRAKLSITTEKDGIFSIPGDLTTMSDSISIEAQGYATLILTLTSLNGLDSIKLKKQTSQKARFNYANSKNLELNSFKKFDVAYYAGLHTETATFDFLQLAQQFYLPKPGAKLTQVKLNRLAFNLNYIFQDSAVGMESTKFRLRIYEEDTVNGGPGSELCQDIIEIKNKDNQNLTIDLSKYEIIISDRSFFVAIEWMRDFTNQGYSIVMDKSGRYKQLINYRPAIGISPTKGAKLNIWALNLKRQWKPYTYFSPDFTDLAMSATILQ